MIWIPKLQPNTHFWVVVAACVLHTCPCVGEYNTIQNNTRTLQITPSQSKMNTSVLSKICDVGSLSFNTLAFNAVLRVTKARWWRPAPTAAVKVGLKAEAPAAKSEERAMEANFIVCNKWISLLVDNKALFVSLCFRSSRKDAKNEPKLETGDIIVTKQSDVATQTSLLKIAINHSVTAVSTKQTKKQTDCYRQKSIIQGLLLACHTVEGTCLHVLHTILVLEYKNTIR